MKETAITIVTVGHLGIKVLVLNGGSYILPTMTHVTTHKGLMRITTVKSADKGDARLIISNYFRYESEFREAYAKNLRKYIQRAWEVDDIPSVPITSTRSFLSKEGVYEGRCSAETGYYTIDELLFKYDCMEDAVYYIEETMLTGLFRSIWKKENPSDQYISDRLYLSGYMDEVLTTIPLEKVLSTTRRSHVTLLKDARVGGATPSTIMSILPYTKRPLMSLYGVLSRIAEHDTQEKYRTPNRDVSSLLRNLRLVKGLSKAEMARRCDVSEATVMRYERHDANILDDMIFIELLRVMIAIPPPRPMDVAPLNKLVNDLITARERYTGSYLNIDRRQVT